MTLKALYTNTVLKQSDCPKAFLLIRSESKINFEINNEYIKSTPYIDFITYSE